MQRQGETKINNLSLNRTNFARVKNIFRELIENKVKTIILVGAGGNGKSYLMSQYLELELIYNSLNSEYNCPAKVLLCAITSVGLFTSWITLDMVKVFPVPVAPRSTCSFCPAFIPFISFLIASG